MKLEEQHIWIMIGTRTVRCSSGTRYSTPAGSVTEWNTLTSPDVFKNIESYLVAILMVDSESIRSPDVWVEESFHVQLHSWSCAPERVSDFQLATDEVGSRNSTEGYDLLLRCRGP